MRLHNRVALITGGGGGIGKAIALKCAAEGAKVMVVDVTQTPREGGPATLDVLAEMGADAAFEPGDVAVWADIDRAVTATVARWGRLDVIVNNAATRAGGPLLETSEADWDRVMAVNAKGVFFGCKRAVQQMLTQAPPADGDPEVRGRSQYLLPARHDPRARGHRLRCRQSGGGLHDSSNRRRLWRPRHCL